VRQLAAAVLLATLLGGAPAPPAPPASDEDGRMAYAHQLFAAGDYDRVVLLLQELIANRPGSRYVEEATFFIGRAYYEQGMDLEAEDQFRQYLRSFRGGNFEAEAQYYLGLALLSELSLPVSRPRAGGAGQGAHRDHPRQARREGVPERKALPEARKGVPEGGAVLLPGAGA
jgi:TolA-binding protein